MKHKYYVIANTDKEVPPLPHSNDWPKLIGFCFENMNILLIVGRGHGLMGGNIELSKFNVLDWLDVFQDTNSNWFKDRIVNGKLMERYAEEKLKRILELSRKIEFVEY